jgi:hypothetical protein
MKSFVTLAMMFGTFLALTANAQEGRQRAKGALGSPSGVILTLRREAAKTATARFSQLFSALSEEKIRAELKLSAEQADLEGRLEKLTRDIIRAWLLRDLDATPPPPPDVLGERLSERGDRLRARVVAHAEEIAIEGILTSYQGRFLNGAIGRKARPLLSDRFGPPAIWVVDEKLRAEQVKWQLQEIGRDLGGRTTGSVFCAMRGCPQLLQFLDPETKQVPPRLARIARPYMPAVDLSKDESGLTIRLDSLTADVVRAWVIRDLEKVPPPTKDQLTQRFMDYPRLNHSLMAHAELIALEGILTQDQADRCLCSIWKEAGMKSLRDPALAARLRLSTSQRDEVLLLLAQKDTISDKQSEAQEPLFALDISRPDVRIVSEEIARDARERLDQVDAIIWDTLTPAQARILSRIMGDKVQPPPRPAAKRKKSTRPG